MTHQLTLEAFHMSCVPPVYKRLGEVAFCDSHLIIPIEISDSAHCLVQIFSTALKYLSRSQADPSKNT